MQSYPFNMPYFNIAYSIAITKVLLVKEMFYIIHGSVLVTIAHRSYVALLIYCECFASIFILLSMPYYLYYRAS